MADNPKPQQKNQASVSPPDWEHDFATRRLKGAFPHLNIAEIEQALADAKREAGPAASHDEIIRRAEQKLTE
jgi:hypothetical protein